MRRMPDHQWDVCHLVVDRHDDLAPQVFFAEQEAVISADNERRVAPEVMSIERVEQAPELEVAVRERGGVVGTQLGHLHRCLGNRAVLRPV